MSRPDSSSERIRDLAAKPDDNGNERTMVMLAEELGVSIATVRKALVAVEGRKVRGSSQKKQDAEAAVVYDAIRAAIIEKGWAPSQREMATATGYTVSRVNYLLQVLKHQRLIELGPNPREIRIVGTSMVVPELGPNPREVTL